MATGEKQSFADYLQKLELDPTTEGIILQMESFFGDIWSCWPTFVDLLVEWTKNIVVICSSSQNKIDDLKKICESAFLKKSSQGSENDKQVIRTILITCKVYACSLFVLNSISAFDVGTKEMDKFHEDYPQFSPSQAPELSVVEQHALCKFRKYMALSNSVVSLAQKKCLLMKVCGRLEGLGVIYSLGGNMSDPTLRRVQIFEKETGQSKKKKRGKSCEKPEKKFDFFESYMKEAANSDDPEVNECNSLSGELQMGSDNNEDIRKRCRGQQTYEGEDDDGSPSKKRIGTPMSSPIYRTTNDNSQMYTPQSKPPFENSRTPLPTNADDHKFPSSMTGVGSFVVSQNSPFERMSHCTSMCSASTLMGQEQNMHQGSSQEMAPKREARPVLGTIPTERRKPSAAANQENMNGTPSTGSNKAPQSASQYQFRNLSQEEI